LCTLDKIRYLENEWISIPLCNSDKILSEETKSKCNITKCNFLAEALIKEAKSNNFKSFKRSNIPLNFKLKFNELTQFRYITKPECIIDLNGQTLVHLEELENYDAIIKATNAINQYYFHTLENSSHQSTGFWTDLAEHFGVYTRNNLLPFTSSNTASSHSTKHHECVNELLLNLKPLSDSVNQFLKKYYRNLYEKLSQLKWGPFAPRPFGVFPMIAINYNIISSYHWDKNDEINSLCCLVALGDYEGGELCFPQLEIIIPLRPNQVVAFSSHFLLHGNLPIVKGIRHSIVYFIHNTFFYNKKRLTNVYNDLKAGIERNKKGQIISSEPIFQDFTNAYDLKYLVTPKKSKKRSRIPVSSNQRRENTGILSLYII
jgi:hypothetical protein